ILDAEGASLYVLRRAAPDSEAVITRSYTQPIRAMLPINSGTTAAQSVGTARVTLTTRDTSPADIGAPVAAAGRSMLNRALFGLGVILVLGLVSAVALAWWAARRIERPISALIRSADRIGQGDLSRPTDLALRDELGELQQALERMRNK